MAVKLGIDNYEQLELKGKLNVQEEKVMTAKDHVGDKRKFSGKCYRCLKSDVHMAPKKKKTTIKKQADTDSKLLEQEAMENDKK
eukprot:Pgem_evm1s753